MSTSKKILRTKKKCPETFNPMLSHLQNLLSNFEEQSSNFPALKLPSTHKRKSNKSKKSPEKKVETPIPKQIRRYTPTLTPESFHAPFFQSFESGVGPGSYQAKIFSIQGGKLLQAPRFAMSPIEKAQQFINLKSKIQQDLPIIEKNKNLEEFNFNKKLEKLEKNKKLKEFEIEVHKNAKKSMEEINHKARLDSYLKKVNGIEWKLRKNERKYMKPPWTILMLGITLACSIKYKIIHRKIFKQKAFKCFSLTVLVSRFIGKLKRKIVAIRTKRLIRCLMTRVSRMKTWIRQKKKNYYSCILQTLDNFSMSSMMTVIMSNFMSKILKVQRALRSMIKVKKERFKVIHRLFIKNSSKIIRKSKMKNPKFVFRHYDIAEKEINSYFRFCYDKYNKLYKEYKKDLIEFIENKNEILMNDPNFKDFDPEPTKPNLILYTDFVDNFESFLHFLMRKQHKKSK